MNFNNETLTHDRSHSPRTVTRERHPGRIFYGWWVALASGHMAPMLNDHNLGARAAASGSSLGSYRGTLVGFFLAILLSTVLMTRLGPYRFRSPESNIALPKEHENSTQRTHNPNGGMKCL